MQDFIHQCGFTVVNVSDDGYISDIHNSVLLQARKDYELRIANCGLNL
jgi:hypothetical protein